MQLLNIILAPKEIRVLTKAIVTYAGIISAQRDVGMVSKEEVDAQLDALNNVLESMDNVVGAALEYYDDSREEQEDR